jgi:hypothetical protein
VTAFAEAVTAIELTFSSSVLAIILSAVLRGWIAQAENVVRVRVPPSSPNLA